MLRVWDWPRLVKKAAQYNYLFQCCHTKLTVSFRKLHSELKINSAGTILYLKLLFSLISPISLLPVGDRSASCLGKTCFEKANSFKRFYIEFMTRFLSVVAQAKWWADSHGIKSVFVPFEDQETFDDILCIQSRSVSNCYPRNSVLTAVKSSQDNCYQF